MHERTEATNEADHSARRLTLDRLNAVDADTFAALLAGVVEHAPEISRAAASARPFATVEALHAAFAAVIGGLPLDDRVELFNRHPELAGREAESGAMTAESVSEQGGAGLDRLSRSEARLLRELNAAYRDRFGFPFLICVRRHTRASIFEEAKRRLECGRDEEIEEALSQMLHVTRLRVFDRVQEAGGL